MLDVATVSNVTSLLSPLADELSDQQGNIDLCLT